VGRRAAGVAAAGPSLAPARAVGVLPDPNPEDLLLKRRLQQ
jgi:hypothetical protein